MNEKNIPQVIFKKGQLLQHVYGGFYKYEKAVTFSEDGQPLAVYQHVWPFPESSYARRLPEFLEKFKPVTQSVLNNAMKEGVEVFKNKIAQNKAQSKSV